ncbi:MAG: GDSL-type esterase/lipase family protein [Bacteroidota bacterium]
MKNFPVLLLMVLLLGTFSCSNEDEGTPVAQENQNSNPDNAVASNRIMPLGASRVEGLRPEFESYRYELWKLLIDAGVNFDYIGTQEDEASYPVYNSRMFDLDHEGRGGWTSGQILNEIESWIAQTGKPDIVLFSSPAGNDALEGLSYDAAILNINGIIDAIQVANPNATIIIEQLAPARTDQMTPQLTSYFNRLQQDVVSIATVQSTTTSRVLVVDMATGFTDALLADDVHYNEAGARFIARRYFEVLQNIVAK